MFRSYQFYLESSEHIQLELNPDYSIAKYFMKNLDDAKETIFEEMQRNLVEFFATIGCETLDINMDVREPSNITGHVIFKNKDVYFYLSLRGGTEIALYDISQVIEKRDLEFAKKIDYRDINSYTKEENPKIKNVIGPYVIMKFKDIATVIKNYHNKKIS